MRHLYRCPLRWADLDLLGHVNNVVYVDYLQEARVDMLRTHAPDRRAADLAEGVVVARNQLRYATSLTLRESVAIECWITEIRAASFTMAYEVFDIAANGDRVVYLQAKSLLTPFVFAEERPRRISDAERASLERFLEPEQPMARIEVPQADPSVDVHWPVNVRFSDVDVYGHVNNVKYFEYFQEARVTAFAHYFGPLIGTDRPKAVVAQMDVDYKRPILFRPEPYDAWSWVSRVGRSSYDVSAEIRDGDDLLARSRCTMVTIDEQTGRAKPGSESFHERLRVSLR